MLPYRRILAAIDLNEDSRAVAARACEVARLTSGTVQLLHVATLVPIEPMSDVPMAQIDDQIIARARAQIEALAQQLGVPPSVCNVEAGNAKSEIIRYARESNIDLIVIGSRERHGLSLLRHRTEDSVLHAAPCDVLTVRVR